MTDYTIGRAAEELGVTARTLRHWDEIGLLSPGWRTETGDYRLYTDADLDRGLDILIYRRAGVPLRDIAVLLAEPGDRRDRLLTQRELLVRRIGHLHRMVRAVDSILEGDTVTMQDKKAIFGEDYPARQAEAEERWGDTGDWSHARDAMKTMDAEGFRRVKAETDAFAAALVDARDRGVAPGDAEADALIERHAAMVDTFYPCTRAKQILLARMYAVDGRFAAYTGDAADYLVELVEAKARAEGIDPDTVAWG
ncbi:MerR family transcriptional regulator [Corynebacterium pygosceleis]|uniref:MerR family transcriptional regulator n=1 Tax=Corynebacterium pygosceleis TaxID=2800406 RepID=A0A9Q4GKF2_9CORY|nr:MerR family transcriptional regulator [Corynebacterium pygosceleis]MCK7638450.1 MerR family transcriptional regulator [Corynebacterium pygosceleis]MCK7675430.1 MerR family transcriptional regulator [Corynebacterium pygosceleis]MCL0121176.1 MerR family transcriptional regulator [Corynebacterium pygosceleis]MCX7445390.1 MerR family transcriptional regulator [Corynebacterium pygosceleis]MCX7469114.1 MerR family transcriptional regulator [Corynebacterium pygosceleis]